MPEWYLLITIGAAAIMSPTSGTNSKVSMHRVGPLPQEACFKAAEAIRESQNVLSAQCGRDMAVQRP